MNKHIKWTSRVVATPPITISTTCRKISPFNIAFSASKAESSISKLLLSIGRSALPPAKSNIMVLIWLPPWAPCHMRSPNYRDPKAAVRETILMLWSQTADHYSTISKTQLTVWQYTAARRSWLSICVVTQCIYQMNNCLQCSSLFTMALRFKLRV